MARPTIFEGGKSYRIQGDLTKEGGQAFERARKMLAALVGWKPSRVSDADTAEFLWRGYASTLEYLIDKGKLKRKG